MQNQTRTAILAVLLVAGSAELAWAKCPNAVIRIYGEIVGQLAPDLQLTMEICPTPRRALPVVSVTSQHFEAEAYFDTFILEAEHGKEYCGRKPESIALVLTDGSKEVARIKLNFEKDFVRDEKGHYALREGVKIQIPNR